MKLLKNINKIELIVRVMMPKEKIKYIPDKPRKEFFEQKEVCEWLDNKNIFYFSVPNEGMRPYGALVKLKQTGLNKGASDLIIMLDDVIVMCETKKRKKVLKSGFLSKEELVQPEQYAFRDRVNKFHYAISIICFGVDDFIRKMNIIINNYKKPF